jgi:hypothetical protein
MKYLLLIVFITCVSACNNEKQSTQNKIPQSNQTSTGSRPRDLDQAVKALDAIVNPVEKTNFKNKAEKKGVSEWHMSFGLIIRNKWIRNDKGSALRNYFNRLGVSHPDDMSSIILTSYHRQLNNKPIDIKQQLITYKKYWSEIEDCAAKADRVAAETYSRYNICDTLTIMMPVTGEGEGANALVYNCPDNFWRYNPAKDLKFTAIIIDKYIINSESNAFFKLQILSMNHKSMQIIGQPATVNSVISLSLKYFNSLLLLPQSAVQSHPKG